MKLEKQMLVPLGFWFHYCSSIVCVFWFVFLFFLSMSKLLFLFLSVASGFYLAENTQFMVSRVLRKRQQERAFQNTS